MNEKRIGKRQIQKIITSDWKNTHLKKLKSKVLDRELISDLEGERDMICRIYNSLIKSILLNDRKNMDRHFRMLQHEISMKVEKYYTLDNNYKKSLDYLLSENRQEQLRSISKK